MNNPIAVLYMGGTFGCIGQPLSPMPASQFLQQLAKIFKTNQNLEYFSAPSIKDSTELNASDWLQLALQIQQLKQQFSKFIIIHGTDTLSYASAFLHHIFKQQLTIILTGSQYPLLDVMGAELQKASDAYCNLNFAIEQISTIPQGVYLAFAQQLHQANQSYKTHTEDFNAFSSLQNSNHQLTLKHDIQISPQLIQQSQTICYVNLYLYPQSSIYLAQQLQQIQHQQPHILILQGFGSGNLPYHADLEKVLQQLITQGCWVIISSQVLYGALSQKYATGSWLNNINLVFDPHYSQADLYARATLLYLQYGDEKNWQQYWDQIGRAHV